MPYIGKEAREIIDKYISKLMKIYNGDIGVLNYIITKILISTTPSSYSEFNQIMGVLECVKHEMYRRLIAEYEDFKKEMNGDVFGDLPRMWKRNGKE